MFSSIFSSNVFHHEDCLAAWVHFHKLGHVVHIRVDNDPKVIRLVVL